jgi:hypothetical protein
VGEGAAVESGEDGEEMGGEEIGVAAKYAGRGRGRSIGEPVSICRGLKSRRCREEEDL